MCFGVHALRSPAVLLASKESWLRWVRGRVPWWQAEDAGKRKQQVAREVYTSVLCSAI